MQAPLEIQVARELDFEAQRVDVLTKEILGHNYMKLMIRNLELKEDFGALRSSLKAELDAFVGEQTKLIRIEGEGVGLVDAAFDGMMRAYGLEHISLASVSVDDFSISIKFRETQGLKSDAYAIALLRMRNSENHEFAFTYRTPSISQSSLAVVVDAIQFFINSERAFVQLHMAVEDAKSRGRSDLAERYQQQMAVLVTATSYKLVVDRLQKK